MLKINIVKNNKQYTLKEDGEIVKEEGEIVVPELKTKSSKLKYIQKKQLNLLTERTKQHFIAGK